MTLTVMLPALYQYICSLLFCVSCMCFFVFLFVQTVRLGYLSLRTVLYRGCQLKTDDELNHVRKV